MFIWSGWIGTPCSDFFFLMSAADNIGHIFFTSSPLKVLKRSRVWNVVKYIIMDPAQLVRRCKFFYHAKYSRRISIHYLLPWFVPGLYRTRYFALGIQKIKCRHFESSQFIVWWRHVCSTFFRTETLKELTLFLLILDCRKIFIFYGTLS